MLMDGMGAAAPTVAIFMALGPELNSEAQCLEGEGLKDSESSKRRVNEFISKSKNQGDTSLWNLEDMSKLGMCPIEDLMQPLVSEIQLAGKRRFPNTVQTN